MSMIAEIQALVNRGFSLTAAVEEVAPGGNVEFFRKAINTPPRRRKPRSRSRYAGRKFQASTVLARTVKVNKAMLETVKRVNEPEPEDDNTILVTANGEIRVWWRQEGIDFTTECLTDGTIRYIDK